MNKNKTKVALLLVLVLSFSMLTGFKHPNKVWPLFTDYSKAKQQKDPNKLIKTGNEIFKVYDGMEMNLDISSVLCPKYKELSKAYLDMGDYDNAKLYMKKHLDLTKFRMDNYGVDETDNLIDGRNILKNISIKPSVFAFSTNENDIPYFGAKYEPKKGTYFGRVVADESEKWSPRQGDSAVLMYIEMFKEEMSAFSYIFDKQVAAGKVIELAWNFPKQFSDAHTIVNGTNDEYIRRNLKYLSTLKTPILLRIGAEQNVWVNPQPEVYKKAFVKVAKMAREIAPNVATVFSLNYISDRTTNYKAFYPGDEFVDWVGVSLYSNKYFGLDDSNQNQLNHGVGKYANPIVLVEQIVKQFGNKKPIIIAEGGSGHYSNERKQDITPFADKIMHYYYGYLPVVYPQIKAIMYFDNNVAGEKYNYKLKGNNVLTNSYNKLTKSDEYIHNYGEKTGSYVPITKFSDKVKDKIILSSYLAFPNFVEVSTNYFVNGNWIGKNNGVISKVSIPINSLNIGMNDLRIKFDAKNGYTKTLEYTIFKGDNHVVTIKEKSKMSPVKVPLSSAKVIVDGKKIDFEAYLINGNTFFKLRDIAYVLNKSKKSFNVTWNGAKVINGKRGVIDMISNANYDIVGGELAKKNMTQAQKATPISSTLLLDGKNVNCVAYGINDNNFFKLRDLGQLLDFGITWNGKERVIEINTNNGYEPE